MGVAAALAGLALASCASGEGTVSVALRAELPAAWPRPGILLGLGGVELQEAGRTLTDEGFSPLPTLRSEVELHRGAAPVAVAEGRVPADAYGALRVLGTPRPLGELPGPPLQGILEPIALPFAVENGWRRELVVELVLLEEPDRAGSFLLFVKDARVGPAVPIP
ncbi:MAG: hypothetical protein IT371_28765 [Deltaproteobacteria bacterium]|nr:hypothetical protein [Deltaproteobacteria bacterium]